MPLLARDALGCLVGVYHEDLGMPLELRRRRRMEVQLAEAPPERLVLLDREVLVPEEDDAIVDEGAVDLLERHLVERMREIEAGDLGADMRSQLPHLDVPAAHGRFPPDGSGSDGSTTG